MTKVSDLFRLQQEADVLITRGLIAQLGRPQARPAEPTAEQLTALYRLQSLTNQRLEALVEQLEQHNAEKTNHTEAGTPECSPEERGRTNG